MIKIILNGKSNYFNSIKLKNLSPIYLNKISLKNPFKKIKKSSCKTIVKKIYHNNLIKKI
jgi:uncharacterized protein YqfB (UPF0267 family)